MKKETKTKIWRTLLVVGIIAILFLAIFLPLYFTGALSKIRNAEELKNLILSGGVWSYLIFFVIQFLQVTFLPIPAAVTTVAGTLVFGPWITCGISFVAVMLASLFSFFLGRKVGKKIVVWIAGEKDYEKWAEKLGKGKYVFFLMMLFPVFPDDILCMVAGTTNMTWKFFTITNLITRPIGIFSTCFLGSGIIPFKGLWLILWAFLLIACVVLFVLSYKYQPQIEAFILKLAKKFERKEKRMQKENDNDNEKSETVVTQENNDAIDLKNQIEENDKTNQDDKELNQNDKKIE